MRKIVSEKKIDIKSIKGSGKDGRVLKGDLISLMGVNPPPSERKIKHGQEEKIKMTTPVTQVEKNGNMSMQFYLPSKFNSENVPNPSREDVKIVNIEGGYYAVLRYSGRASDGNFLKHKEILEKELQKNNISIISPPIRATYDSPFTLPMNRRNEAMFKVELN